MSNNEIELIEKRLKEKKVEEYEIFYIERQIYETHFLKNALDTQRKTFENDYVLRILNQKGENTGIGVIKSNSLDENIIDHNIDNGISLSKINISSKYRFPEQREYPKLNLAEKELIKDPIDMRNTLSQKLKSEIDNIDNVVPTFGRFRIHIDHAYLKNTNGINTNSLKTYFFIEFAVKSSKNGKLAEYWDVDYIKNKAQLNFKDRVKNWARIAIESLNAKPPKADDKATVIFSPGILESALNGVIGHHSLGKAHFEKLSQFEIDQKVASDNLTVIDNGILKGGIKSNPWDGEGSPRQKSVIIDGGTFKKRLYDERYAILDDEKSTGNGVRTENGDVRNDITNLEILPGNLSLEEMISNVKTGYHIDRCSWLRPDPRSGNFGAEIRTGYFIKDGKYQYPIKGGNISGNILEMIKNCESISKERRYSRNVLYPYMTFNNLTISF